jgi:hypothetical protein
VQELMKDGGDHIDKLGKRSPLYHIATFGLFGKNQYS